jgi:nucleoside-triphosphatase THEP1
MVRIITGNIHSGKTTKMIELYEEKRGDGFVSIKNMIGSQVKGYDYLQLSIKRTGPLASKEKIEPVRDILGPYYFNEEAMTYIEKCFEEFIEDHVSPLFLDEVGQLELKGKGFYPILSRLFKEIDPSVDVYLSVRRPFVEEVIKLFNLSQVEIIE